METVLCPTLCTLVTGMTFFIFFYKLNPTKQLYSNVKKFREEGGGNWQMIIATLFITKTNT